jgi:hypothetical protein
MDPIPVSTDATFLSTVAEVAGTLLGITFLALSFFLVRLLTRYKNLALPVMPCEFGSDSAIRAQPVQQIERITDANILDGNPMMVFMAFSVAVTWNLLQYPLILSLVLLSSALARPALIAAIMAALSGVLIFCILIRHTQFKRLNVYRTREERLWTPGEFVVICVYVLSSVAAIVVTVQIVFNERHTGLALISWRGAAVTNDQLHAWLVTGLKLIFVVSILLGIYVTNKDLFEFFKADVSDKMRRRWLRQFMRGTYRELVSRVAEAATNLDDEALFDRATEMLALIERWNGGVPTEQFIRHSVDMSVHLFSWRPYHADYQTFVTYWNHLRSDQSRLVAAWMVDVPGIYEWSQSVEEALDAMVKT